MCTFRLSAVLLFYLVNLFLHWFKRKKRNLSNLFTLCQPIYTFENFNLLWYPLFSTREKATFGVAQCRHSIWKETQCFNCRKNCWQKLKVQNWIYLRPRWSTFFSSSSSSFSIVFAVLLLKWWARVSEWESVCIICCKQAAIKHPTPVLNMVLLFPLLLLLLFGVGGNPRGLGERRGGTQWVNTAVVRHPNRSRKRRRGRERERATVPLIEGFSFFKKCNSVTGRAL